MLTNAGHCYS